MTTRAFLEALLDYASNTIQCYYEEAPAGASFPFAVVGGIYVTELGSGDSLNFYIDLFADEKQENATVSLEDLTDKMRRFLSGAVISKESAFHAHIGFENQKAVTESEFDLSHRRLTMTARIFYF